MVIGSGMPAKASSPKYVRPALSGKGFPETKKTRPSPLALPLRHLFVLKQVLEIRQPRAAVCRKNPKQSVQLLRARLIL